MRSVSERAVVPGSADDAYARLADFERYPELAPSVLRVAVEPAEDGADGRRRCLSSWEVKFRDGLLAWEERDVFDPDARTIAFEQTRGDLELFRGSWSVDDHADGAEIRFEADFDLGLPGLDTFLEPVAQRALEDNVREIIFRLFDVGVGA